MQLVQTRMRLLPPETWALTDCRLTFQRRRVVLWACEMLLPNCGPLPQRSHFCAMTCSDFQCQSRVAELPSMSHLRELPHTGETAKEALEAEGRSGSRSLTGRSLTGVRQLGSSPLANWSAL